MIHGLFETADLIDEKGLTIPTEEVDIKVFEMLCPKCGFPIHIEEGIAIVFLRCQEGDCAYEGIVKII